MSHHCQADNQGLCHTCGRPMNLDYYAAAYGYTDETLKRWQELVEQFHQKELNAS